jgi:phosphatidylglycerol:prolipoprotein diacylglycerol transferase
LLVGLLYGTAYLVGVWAFVAAARRRGLDTDGIWALAGAALIGGLIGAGLAQFVATQAPGKSILGGIAGGYLTVIAAKRYFGIVRPTGDLFAFALSAGEAVGRIACFVAGCCYGKGFGGPWSVWQHDEWRHPTQLYLSACALITFLILRRFERLRPPENTIFFLQGMLFCTYRFAVEFFRANTNPTGILDVAQLACLAGLGFFAHKFFSAVRTAKSLQRAGASA